MKAKIDAIFLDIGGVILEIDWRRTLNELGITDPTTQLSYVDRFNSWEVHDEYERGNVTSESFLEEMMSFFNFTGTKDQIEKAWHALVVGPLPGIERVFNEFEGKAPFYTLSNTNRLHFDVFSHEPVFRRFDKLLTSFELRERKPDLAIYEKAAAAVGVSPESCLFLDDNEKNIAAARKVGFHAELSVNSVERSVEIIESYL